MKTILEAWTKALWQYPQWRIGQALFNVLLEHAPAVAEELRGQAFDPFYDDRQIGNALQLIEARTRQVTFSADDVCDYGAICDLDPASGTQFIEHLDAHQRVTFMSDGRILGCVDAPKG